MNEKKEGHNFSFIILLILSSSSVSYPMILLEAIVLLFLMLFSRPASFTGSNVDDWTSVSLNQKENCYLVYFLKKRVGSEMYAC